GNHRILLGKLLGDRAAKQENLHRVETPLRLTGSLAGLWCWLFGSCHWCVLSAGKVNEESSFHQVPQEGVLPPFQACSPITAVDKNDRIAQSGEPGNIRTEATFVGEIGIILPDWPRFMAFQFDLLHGHHPICVNQENPSL